MPSALSFLPAQYRRISFILQLVAALLAVPQVCLVRSSPGKPNKTRRLRRLARTIDERGGVDICFYVNDDETKLIGHEWSGRRARAHGCNLTGEPEYSFSLAVQLVGVDQSGQPRDGGVPGLQQPDGHAPG